MKASDLTLQSDCTPAQFRQLIKDSAYLVFLSIMDAIYLAKEKFIAYQLHHCAYLLLLFCCIICLFLLVQARTHEDPTILWDRTRCGVNLHYHFLIQTGILTASSQMCSQKWLAALLQNDPVYLNHQYTKAFYLDLLSPALHLLLQSSDDVLNTFCLQKKPPTSELKSTMLWSYRDPSYVSKSSEPESNQNVPVGAQ